MKAALHGVVYSLAILVAGPAASRSVDALAQAPVSKKAAEYADPKSTYRTYLEAVRRNDLSAATKCWALDDDKSGALAVLVGRSISIRQLHQVAVKKFGNDGRRAIPEDWGLDQVTDQALDLTKKRVEKAEVRITGDKARLSIKREEGEGRPKPAFEDDNGALILFRKVGGGWKIDANALLGIKRGIEFFEFKDLPLGEIFSGNVVIAHEAVAGMQQGKLKTAKELEQFIARRCHAWPKEYAGWHKKHIGEMKKAGAKRK